MIGVPDETSGFTYYYNPLTNGTMWELPTFMDGRLNHKYREAETDNENSYSGSEKSDNDSINSGMSEDSEKIREKRRKMRKYPRYLPLDYYYFIHSYSLLLLLCFQQLSCCQLVLLFTYFYN